MEWRAINYYREYRKCAFSGRLLFDDDHPLSEASDSGPPLWFANPEMRRAYRERWPIERVAAELSSWRRPAAAPDPGLDPVTLEVVGNALSSIVGQMAETMARTAYSPVFAEARDFSCALFDADLELVAQQHGLPAQVGSMRYCVPWAVRRLGVAMLAPGDVILHNDPQMGVPHLPELCVIRPIFADGRIVMYAATIAHQTDVGGKSPGSMPGDARDIFQEGLVIPPVKLHERGQEATAVFALLLANVRSPASMYGDVCAMCGSLITAERLIGQLLARYPLPELTRYAEELKNYAERRLRAELAKLPAGIFRGRAVIDDDGVGTAHFTVELALVVSEDGLIADFRGSSPQAAGPINCTYSVACAATLNAVLHLIGAEVPNNEGLHRAITVIAPPGTIVNVNHPGAFNSGQTESHNLLVEAFMDALLTAAPERVCAPCASTTCLVTGGAWLPARGETVTFITWDGAGWGAFIDHDGNSAISRYCGTTGKNYPTEVLETHFPWLVRSAELRSDSGGPGRFRGGLGMVREYLLRAPELEFGVNSNRGRFAPAGVLGGEAGKPTRYWVRRGETVCEPMQLGAGIVSPDKFSGVRLAEGDGLTVETPGGGGWGDAATRDRDRVVNDLCQGYISRTAAVETYGLDPALADATVARYHWSPPPRRAAGGVAP